MSTGRPTRPGEDLAHGHGASAGGPSRPRLLPAASGSPFPEELGQCREGRGHCPRAEETPGTGDRRAEKEGEGSSAAEAEAEPSRGDARAASRHSDS